MPKKVIIAPKSTKKLPKGVNTIGESLKTRGKRGQILKNLRRAFRGMTALTPADSPMFTSLGRKARILVKNQISNKPFDVYSDNAIKIDKDLNKPIKGKLARKIGKKIPFVGAAITAGQVYNKLKK